MMIAIGAVKTPMSQPAAAGPARPASCSVDWSLPFASAIWSLRTSDGMKLWFETSKNTVAMPMTSATTYRCQICRTPNIARTGSAPSATARTASAQIMTWRLRMRSIHAPAGSPTTRNAANCAAPSTPTSHSLALRISTASTGSASSVICPPNWLSAWPLHRVRKLRSRQSDPVGFRAGAAASAVGLGVGQLVWLGHANQSAPLIENCQSVR